MITKNEVFVVGQTAKPHGVKGEISFNFSKDNFDEEKLPYYIFEIDGIYVPFFVEDYRFKTDTTALVKLEGIDTDEQARSLSNHTIYIHQQFALKEAQEELGIAGFIGFTVEDKKLGLLGKITDVDDSTDNVLFVIEHQGEELLIPATDDFITTVDEEKRIIYMTLPEGLVNLQEAIEE
jgi:16S rRNA processing protein RimM